MSNTPAPSRRRRAAQLLAGALAALIVLDVALGRISPEPPFRGGFLYAAGSTQRYDTVECAFDVEINSLGLREREFPVDRSARPRVIAVGDSFTWGWGVNAQDTWPRALERRLAADGLDCEVLNVARQSTTIAEYATIAARAVPVLRPDLVIVGVHQVDDLWQTTYSHGAWVGAGFETPWWRFLTLPNLRRLAAGAPTPPPSRPIADKWRDESRAILAKFDAAARRRFDALPAEVRAAFENATLNPGMVEGGVVSPEWYRPIDPASRDPKVVAGLAAAAEGLATIARVCKEGGAALLVVSLPDGAFVTEADRKGRADLGYDVDPAFLHGDAADAAIRDVCARAGVRLVAPLEAFRRAAPERGPLYTLWHGHPNAAGCALIADEIAPDVRDALQKR